MGLHFGNLARVRHVITYSLSPFEQRAFPNVFSHGLPNVWRRFSSQVFKVVPQEFERLKRKNPADYEHDQ
ncbi:QCR8 protein, partial [Chloroceryle aenea]|nr:QCR8 protein [Chloroceryle aenea]